MLEYYCGNVGIFGNITKKQTAFLWKMPFRVDSGLFGRKFMYRKLVSTLYVINIVSQAIFTLATPIAIGALASYLLVKYAACPPWIWAVLVTLGALTGLYSMVKFILSAMAGLDRLESEHNTKEKQEQSGKDNE